MKIRAPSELEAIVDAHAARSHRLDHRSAPMISGRRMRGDETATSSEPIMSAHMNPRVGPVEDRPSDRRWRRALGRVRSGVQRQDAQGGRRSGRGRVSAGDGDDPRVALDADRRSAAKAPRATGLPGPSGGKHGDGYITNHDFRAFAFANAVKLWGAQNPKFFEDTRVAKGSRRRPRRGANPNPRRPPNSRRQQQRRHPATLPPAAERHPSE